MLRKETVVDVIQIQFDGQINVRSVTRIYDDNELLAERFHREVLEPRMAPSHADSRVDTVCKSLWTEDVITAYEEAKRIRREDSENVEPVQR